MISSASAQIEATAGENWKTTIIKNGSPAVVPDYAKVSSKSSLRILIQRFLPGSRSAHRSRGRVCNFHYRHWTRVRCFVLLALLFHVANFHLEIMVRTLRHTRLRLKRVLLAMTLSSRMLIQSRKSTLKLSIWRKLNGCGQFVMFRLSRNN